VGRGGGRRLAEVEGARFSVDSRNGEAAAADVAGRGKCDGERERCCDGRVHGVAALRQHVATDPRRDRVVGHDHAARSTDDDGLLVGPVRR